MKKDNKPEPTRIRLKAEKLLKVPDSQGVRRMRHTVQSTSDQPVNSIEAEMLNLIYELEVHQVELEMQNEELTRARSAEKMAAERYVDLYDFAPTGYFTLSRDGEIIELNLCGAKMLGRDRLILKGSRFGLFIADDTKPMFNLFLYNIFTDKKNASCEISLSPDGRDPIYLQLSGILEESYDYCLISAMNITERRLAEEKVLAANEQLVKINTEKDKFFSILAHDLLSPFNNLLGFSKMLLEETEDLTATDIHQIAKSLRTSVTNLYGLLENLLEWSRLQSGLTSSSHHPESFQVSPRITESVQQSMELAGNKNVDIRIRIPENLSAFADKNMFGSIIHNLVTNAVKFSFRGGIVEIAAKSDDGKMVEISIMDQGIGMDQSIRDKLFRIDDEANRKGTEGEPSTGLGLIICKDLVEKSGGEIWVKSQVGKGSTFYFTVPGSRSESDDLQD